MFWGNSAPKHAAGSLRTVLFQLRRELSSLGDSVILSQGDTISISVDKIDISDAPAEQHSYLEGIDLKLDGCEGFEEWLRETRSAHDLSQNNSSPDSGLSGLNLTDLSTTGIGILPPVFRYEDELRQVEPDLFFEELIRHISQTTSLKIFDLRGKTASQLYQIEEHWAGETLFVRSFVSSGGPSDRLYISVERASDGEVIWTFDPIEMQSELMEVAAAYCFEILMDRAALSHPQKRPPNLLPWATLSSLFSLDESALHITEAQLRNLNRQGGHPVVGCLLQFTQIFKHYEGFAGSKVDSLDQLREILSNVPVSDPLRPLCESLIGYSAHMLLSDNEFSMHLLETANMRAPNMALNLDHLAVVRLASGDIAGADVASSACMHRSSVSSWKYSYEITRSMIALAKGDHKAALSFANRSLIDRPDFVGGLRYAMLGYALDGNEPEADRIRNRILSLRPDYDLTGWFEQKVHRGMLARANNVSLTLCN